VSGQTWTQLILMGAFTSVAFFLPAFFTCATREHRKMMLHALVGLVGRVFPANKYLNAEAQRAQR